MNPTIGTLPCPHCGGTATVHREARGQRAMYYRCYDGPHGPCGTIQCRGPGGQHFIRNHMTPLDTAGQDQAAAEAAEHAREQSEQETRKERRRGAFLRFLEDNDA